MKIFPKLKSYHTVDEYVYYYLTFRILNITSAPECSNSCIEDSVFLLCLALIVS